MKSIIADLRYFSFSPMGDSMLLSSHPLGEGMRWAGEGAEWSNDRSDANSDYNTRTRHLDEKAKKLDEAGKQDECDREVIVCWKINLRAGKHPPLPILGSVVVYEKSVIFPTGGGTRCELVTVRGRGNNCCKHP